MLKSSVTIALLSEGAGSTLPELAVILHLKALLVIKNEKISHYMESMYVYQPAATNKNYWFSASIEVSVTIALLSEGTGSNLPGLAVILHLKYDKKVYIQRPNYYFVYFCQQKVVKFQVKSH